MSWSGSRRVRADGWTSTSQLCSRVDYLAALTRVRARVIRARENRGHYNYIREKGPGRLTSARARIDWLD